MFVRDNLHLCLRGSACKWYSAIPEIDKLAIRTDSSPSLYQWIARLQTPRFHSQLPPSDPPPRFPSHSIPQGPYVPSQTPGLTQQQIDIIAAAVRQFLYPSHPLLKHISSPTSSVSSNAHRINVFGNAPKSTRFYLFETIFQTASVPLASSILDDVILPHPLALVANSNAYKRSSATSHSSLPPSATRSFSHVQSPKPRNTPPSPSASPLQPITRPLYSSSTRLLPIKSTSQ